MGAPASTATASRALRPTRRNWPRS